MQNQREDFFLFAPPPFPPEQDCFKQFPTPGPEGLDLSQGYPGGMVTSKIEPSIKQGSILINTYCPLSPNLDKEKIEFHVLFVESPVFFFMSLPIFLYHWLAGLLLQCQPIFLLPFHLSGSSYKDLWGVPGLTNPSFHVPWGGFSFVEMGRKNGEYTPVNTLG